jgi:exopolysaccharide production protein ExoY
MSASQYIEGVWGQPGSDGVRWADRLALVQRVLAAGMLVLTSPLWLLLIATIWMSDGAPIFFGHYRVGRDGKLFRCLKFRTMKIDSDRLLAEHLRSNEAARLEWARDQKLRNDPRVTLIGGFLRKTSLDELPQLLNVVRGEMTLVGPRPVTPAELTRYGTTRWHYVSVVPGITGLWQVSGRNRLSYDERVNLDRQYVEGRSAWLDLRILFRTVWVVLTGHGAM